MAKIGRNDPCHCGSGKKYKKCCMKEDEKQQINIAESELAKKRQIVPFLAYEDVDIFTTEEIIEKLEEMNIPFNQETFLEDVNRFHSAEALSDNWFSTYPVMATGRMGDFPWYAAWVLWERLAPSDHLSMEQIDDLIEYGINRLEKDDPVVGCDFWLKAWDAIKHHHQPEDKNLNMLDERYADSFSVFNFCQDLEHELDQAGKKDAAYFEKRIDYCRDFCTSFPDESELIIHNMRRAIADSYSQLGQYQQGETEFKKIVQDFPKNPWGYIGWGDMYFMDMEKDFKKAKELYEMALTTADQFDIDAVKERITSVEEETLD